jgi:hypothetical protein
MMLGHPEAVVAEGFDVAGEVGGVAQRLPRVTAFGDWREIENGQRKHRAQVVPRRVISMRNALFLLPMSTASPERRSGDGRATHPLCRRCTAKSRETLGFRA